MQCSDNVDTAMIPWKKIMRNQSNPHHLHKYIVKKRYNNSDKDNGN